MSDIGKSSSSPPPFIVSVGRGSILKVVLVGVTSVILWIASEIASKWQEGSLTGDDPPDKFRVSTAIRVLFAAGVIFPLSGFWFLLRAGTCGGFSATISAASSDQDVWWIHLPSLSLLVIFFFRLVAGQQNFQTYPSGLDFGPKYGLVYSDDGSPVETNVAFDPEFNTWTHCLQGVFAATLAYVGVILQQNGRRWYWIVSFIASALTIYPIYNFLKRAIKSHETFATSSYSNNGTEWAFGFWGGMALGQCLYYFHLTRNKGTDGVANSSRLVRDGQDESEASKSSVTATRIVTILRALLGGALWITVYGSAILYGYTWNNCREPEDPETEECILDPSKGANVGAIVGFIATPVVFTAMTYFWMRRS